MPEPGEYVDLGPIGMCRVLGHVWTSSGRDPLPGQRCARCQQGPYPDTGMCALAVETGGPT